MQRILKEYTSTCTPTPAGARNLKEYRWTKHSSFLFGVLTFCRFWFKRCVTNGECEETK